MADGRQAVKLVPLSWRVGQARWLQRLRQRALHRRPAVALRVRL